MPDPMTGPQVAEKLRELRAQYVSENGWFRFYTDGNDAMNPDKFADAAGRAYEHVMLATTALPLGDTKIRSDADLVSNFGLSDGEAAAPAAAPGPPRSSSSAAMLTAAGPAPVGGPPRPGSSATASPGAAPSPGAASPPPGAILSNKKWSPMLNDAFIMGGLHTCKQFVFAPVGDDLSFIASIVPGGNSASPKQQQIDAAIPAWRAFFQTKQYLLWDRGYPRVFVRELLGLQKFGYKAAPTAINLSFDYSDEAIAKGATFKAYCQHLKDTGFYANKRQDVLRILAKFLFGESNERALDNVGA